MEKFSIKGVLLGRQRSRPNTRWVTSSGLGVQAFYLRGPKLERPSNVSNISNVSTKQPL